MAHPLVEQLRFTRGEWLRALEGVSEEDAVRRLAPMNSISWMAGHLAWQEQAYWVRRAQGITLVPELDEIAGYGKPPTTPPLGDMWAAWRTVTAAADKYLDSVTVETLQSHLVIDGRTIASSVGSMLQRMIYHYWYHIGESQAVRQMLGHTGLPEFVGNIQVLAPYTPEAAE